MFEPGSLSDDTPVNSLCKTSAGSKYEECYGNRPDHNELWGHRNCGSKYPTLVIKYKAGMDHERPVRLRVMEMV